MLTKKWKSYFFMGFIAAVAMCLALGSTAKAAQKEIRIGFLTALTGPGAHLGRDCLNGLKMYLEEIGYNMEGLKVKLFVEDTELKPAVAVTKAEKLIRHDKVHMFVGGIMGSTGYALGALADREKALYVCSIPASDDLTQRKRPKWFVRTGWASSQPNHPFGEWAYEQGYRKAITISADYAFGQEQVQGFHAAFNRAGGRVIQQIWVPVHSLDFGPYLPLFKKEADCVFALMVAAMPGPFLKQYKASGLKMAMLGGGTTGDESVLPKMGDEALGLVTPLQYSAALDTPKNKAFVKEYRKLHGKVPSYYSESNYTTGLWIHLTVKRLKGDLSNMQRFIEEFQKVEIDAIRGPVRLDKYRNVVQNVYVRKVERIDGELWNTVIKTYPAVSQFWKFDPEEFLKQPVYSRNFPPCKYCK
jgi:branched-chain amino acid transport system substrate-binding protein